jgi:ATP:corrinoid adenosyltransferase
MISTIEEAAKKMLFYQQKQSEIKALEEILEQEMQADNALFEKIEKHFTAKAKDSSMKVEIIEYDDFNVHISFNYVDCDIDIFEKKQNKQKKPWSKPTVTKFIKSI